MRGKTTNLMTGSKLADRLSIVCFGASSGGFAAYCTILSLLPTNTGMAYVIVHRQPADGKSLLIDILPHKTKMPVVLVSDGEIVKANHVYVVPAGMQVTLEGDVFRLSPIHKTPGWPKNISVFLRSLAADRQKRPIAVILSGFDSDGAAALKPIKDAGGLVFAQEFKTAGQPDMPRSAVETGCVDQLLSPAGLAAKLINIGRERARFKHAPQTVRSLRTRKRVPVT
jgi:two-component system, chemotaxis family, protein-glutamate methylesterase/glutaminase